ncbi:DNA-binding protein [Streptosporangium sp. KLBMP 9127]|nr:DNA-binding protein [Streptosporangium sp. KLBMP 9127]
MRPGLTSAQIRTLPAVVDLVTAGRALGLGRTKSYQLAKAGSFPCRIIRAGRTYLVPTAELLTLLGLDDDHGGLTYGPRGRAEE